MNIHYILLSIVSSLILFLGALAYYRNKQSATNKAFMFLCFSLAVWVFIGGYLVNGASFMLFNPDLWMRITFTLGILMGTCIIYLAFVFPKRQPILKWHQKLWIIMGLSFLPLSLFTRLLVAETKLVDERLIIKNGPLIALVMIWGVFCIAASFTMLFSKYRQSQGLVKMQYKYLFLGVSSFGLMGLTFNLILPGLGFDSLLNFGLYGPIFLIGFVGYAITKHRLWDIRLVFVKSLAYSFIIASIASMYVLVILYLTEPIKKTFNISPNATFVLMGFVIAFGFNPFKKLIERVTDKFFYKKRYNPEELLEKLGKMMDSTLLVGPLMESLLLTILKKMRIEKGGFVLTSGLQMREVKEVGLNQISVSSWKKLLLFINRKALFIRDELQEESPEKKLLRELAISVIVPFFMEGEPVGFLLLGEKESGDIYTVQDLNFLEVFSHQAAVALHNALLFKKEEKKVIELNSLNKLSSSLVKTLDLQTLLDKVIKEALFATKSQSGSIMLLDKETKTLSIKASQGIPLNIVKKTKIKLGEGIAGFVAKEGEPLILSKNKKTPFKEELKRDDITSSLTVCLNTKEKTIGVININRKGKQELFGEEDKNLITSFAAQAAVAIENARLYTEAITDGLTSLYNHNYFQLKLGQEIVLAQREALPLSLLLIDIDHFKELNDTFGHQIGDRMLTKVASTLKESIKGGLVARYGGEEFAIILPDKSLEEASEIAEELRAAIEAQSFQQANNKISKVTISLGVSSLSEVKDKRSALKDLLIKQADEALYDAKKCGRNNVKTSFSVARPA